MYVYVYAESDLFGQIRYSEWNPVELCVDNSEHNKYMNHINIPFSVGFTFMLGFFVVFTMTM